MTSEDFLEVLMTFTFRRKNIACFEQNEASWHQVLQEEGALMLQICHFHISDENENAGESEEALVAWWCD